MERCPLIGARFGISRGGRSRALLAALFTALGALLCPAVARAAEETYTIRPGDVLNVTVSPQTAYGRVITVQPDGKVNYPVAGEIQAAGLTLAQFTEHLTLGLLRELNNPRVTVSLQTAAPRPLPQVTVLGAVRTPGLYDLREGWRLTELLAAAGGPAPNADLRRIAITHADRTVETVDLSLDTGGLPKQNPAIRPNDLVLVLEGLPKPPPQVTILGAVRSPGLFDLRTGWRLTEVLAQAGGPAPNADLSRVTVTRSNRSVQIVDLSPGANGVPKENPAVEAGDLIVVLEGKPERPTVSVLGEVAQPGTFDLLPGMTLLEAISRAGGPTPKADLKRVGYLRKGGGDVEIVDIEAVRRGESGGPRIELQAGDTIILRENPQRAIVLGEVAQQGPVALQGSETALDLLVRAGGPSGSADLAKATILRKGPDGRPQSIPVDLRKATKGEKEALRIESGDLLFIPPRDQRTRTDWTRYLNPLSLIFGLFGGGF